MNTKSKTKEIFSIRDERIKSSIEGLDNLIRAEYNSSKNFLDYYAGKDKIGNVNNIKNQVIYGRRGTGKTHLLRALQETLLEDSSYFPVYIDVRSFKPLLNDENPLYYALIV
jgi:DNA replication protein DnaC